MTETQNNDMRTSTAKFFSDWRTILGGIAAILIVLFMFLKDSKAVESLISELAQTGSIKTELKKVKEGQDSIKMDIRELQIELQAIQRMIGRLSSIQEINDKPPLEFVAEGSTIVDFKTRKRYAPIGATLLVSWNFIKHRDCGPPIVQPFLRNGHDVIHGLTNMSAVDDLGRGVVYPSNSELIQNIKYTVEIPDDDHIVPGLGFVWVVVNYPACPNTESTTSPEIAINILPKQDNQ